MGNLRAGGRTRGYGEAPWRKESGWAQLISWTQEVGSWPCFKTGQWGCYQESSRLAGCLDHRGVGGSPLDSGLARPHLEQRDQLWCYILGVMTNGQEPLGQRAKAPRDRPAEVQGSLRGGLSQHTPRPTFPKPEGLWSTPCWTPGLQRTGWKGHGARWALRHLECQVRMRNLYAAANSFTFKWEVRSPTITGSHKLN